MSDNDKKGRDDQPPTHAEIAILAWDSENEPYEDFLERIPPEAAAALADGRALLANPAEGYEIVGRFAKSMEEGGPEAWMEYVQSLTTDETARNAFGHVVALRVAVDQILKDLKDRGQEIHMESCEVCQGNEKRRAKLEDVLGKAVAEFMDAMGDEDHDFDDEDDDSDAWKKGAN